MRGFEFLVPFNRQIAEQEAMAARKRLAWERRKRLVPQEVLAYSDATDAEKDFLLGKTDTDPDPHRVISYADLRPGTEALDIPEEVVLYEQLIPSIRFTPGERTPIIRQLLNTAFSNPLPAPTLEQSGSIWRQARFHTMVEEGINSASLDMSHEEMGAIFGVRDFDGNPVVDDTPFRFVEYHALVPRGEDVYKAE